MLGGNGIIHAIDHWLEAFFDEDFGGLQRFAHIGIERPRFAQHLKLHQIPAARFARQSQRSDGVVGGKAACGVGQIGVFLRVDKIGQHRRIGVGHVHAADGDRDDLSARRFKRGGVLGEVLILAGADNQAAGEGAASDGPAVAVLRAATDEMHDFQLIPFPQLHLMQR